MPVRMSIFGVIVLLGPLLGPVIGGYLAEEANWRWCFFLNLPIGVGLVTLLLLGLPRQAPNLKLMANADWLGIAGMAVAFSCLTVALEEGNGIAGLNRRPSYIFPCIVGRFDPRLMVTIGLVFSDCRPFGYYPRSVERQLVTWAQPVWL